MKAGRELDLRVARVVFGVKKFYHNEQDVIWFFDGKDNQLLPFYSTNGADMKKIFELSWAIGVETMKDSYLVGLNIGGGFGEANGDTLEEAACNAALKAVGHD